MKTLFVIAALCLSAHAQTWVKVATEADTLTSGPITVRYGASTGTTYAGVNCATSNCWVTVTLKSATNLSLSDASGNLFGVADPAPGVPKELDIQEGPAALTVTVSGKAKTVPALPPTTATYLLTCNAAIPSGTPPTTITLTNCMLVKQASTASIIISPPVQYLQFNMNAMTVAALCNGGCTDLVYRGEMQ